MLDFLSVTLSGHPPPVTGGETANLEWQWIEDGVFMLTPRRGHTQSVVLSAGIHGNETAPIEILNQLVSDLLTGKLLLAIRLLVILGNPPAIKVGERYLTADINRMFGGRHQNYPPCDETRRAETLEQKVIEFFAADPHSTRLHYDLHTAIRASHHTRFGLLPYQPTPYSSTMLRWLQDIELDALVMHTSAGGTFAHFSSEHCQAASCTLELGKALPFGKNQLEQFSMIIAGLRAVACGGQLPERTSGSMKFYRVVKSLLKKHPDFKLWVSDDTVNFTRFKQGTLMAEQLSEVYRVEHEYEWILFPNPRVALGLRAGIMLVQMDGSELPKS
ncbi:MULTISPECIES: succinylglutamate desuccinylase [Yersinia]|uniref:succinylglutamate desuccinylase n=3 Tax=Yersiniaceae TaxID=1903411 RepID=UPI0005E7B7F1|nr:MULTISPECIES: succinylglutamate desuccinylase [Yersinia]OVZ95575.1 succinylglutamate desuccinylase [Yersinia frederiksenii]RXA97799.1 succinylglutamate desuccinylase [Yersinia sp. 2105 StPb PI]CNI25941.1 succinylglutamate desuccinylase [Yersinia frederiksenii]CNJ02457.1 succinylglutamate desuccinylase [Yersinia frederiksenii]CNL13500.1 succinylglutamate desuccinylase [Yersinia frederiksenii]